MGGVFLRSHSQGMKARHDKLNSAGSGLGSGMPLATASRLPAGLTTHSLPAVKG
jgi:hypothetical protein